MHVQSCTVHNTVYENKLKMEQYQIKDVNKIESYTTKNTDGERETDIERPLCVCVPQFYLNFELEHWLWP